MCFKYCPAVRGYVRSYFSDHQEASDLECAKRYFTMATPTGQPKPRRGEPRVCLPPYLGLLDYPANLPTYPTQPLAIPDGGRQNVLVSLLSFLPSNLSILKDQKN